jgi:hypothetical protein
MGTVSRWNRLVECVLAEDGLTVAELRLALALARLLPGWRRPEARLGRQLLRDTARLDGRNLERARQGLVARGILAYTPGKRGRGNRGLYSFLPWIDEKTAPQRLFTADGKDRSESTEKTALQRPRIDRGKGKTTAHSCIWNGHNRERLTETQLVECACELCAEWADHRAAAHELTSTEAPA